MGIRCSCGVIVNTTAENVPFQFIESNEVHTGTATYVADACADRSELATVSLVFVDTDGIAPNNSFTFTSTSISNIQCEQVNGFCNITIIGNGLVIGETDTRQFIAVFQDGGGLNNDEVLGFSISGFAAQTTDVIVPPASVTALGCQE
jgi:hypothetical protein